MDHKFDNDQHAEAEHSGESGPDVDELYSAAFDGDPEALALLQEIADNGDFEALEFAEIAEDNNDCDEEGDVSDEEDGYDEVP